MENNGRTVFETIQNGEFLDKTNWKRICGELNFNDPGVELVVKHEMIMSVGPNGERAIMNYKGD